MSKTFVITSRELHCLLNILNIMKENIVTSQMAI